MARRKSAVHRLAPEVRQHLERLLREDRLTLSEIIADVKLAYPSESTPSRSSVHRYRTHFDEMVKRMREQRDIAEALVGELGDGIGEKSAELLAQAVTTVVTHAALGMQDRDDVHIDEARKLARAAKDALDTTRVSRKERQEIEAAAQAKIVREQSKKLDAMGKRGAINAETLARIRTEIYGLS